MCCITKKMPYSFLHDIIDYECNSVKFKKIMYDACQNSSAPPSAFSQNQQEMSDIFSVVNFEYTACYCCSVEYILLHMSKRLSKWHGMVMCLLSNGLLLNFLWQKKKSVTKIHRQLKNFTASMLLTKLTVGHWASKITVQVELSDARCSGQPTTTTGTALMCS